MKRTVLLLLSVLTGCSHQLPEKKFPALEQRLERPAPSYNSGSIWQSSGSGLAEDPKARNRGDTVTVVVAEQTSAIKEASTGTSRSVGVDAGIPNFFGLEGSTTLAKNGIDLSKLISASTSSSFDGSGSTSRRDNLSATITARVIDVLPNGNLLIEGRRSVMVNHEEQIIVLEGTVRPRDITADNMVNSSLVADARITYSGRGIISDRQQPGWLMNIIDVIWPF